MQNIKEFLKCIPAAPGIYQMIDKNGNIIYIGKAKDLSKRIPSYFRQTLNRNNQIEKMVTLIDHIDIITTSNEVEALILENNLIKEYKPKYNTLLRDDKTYPYIEVTLGDEYPRILITRKTTNKKSKYYGPFPDVNAAHEIIELLKEFFGIRNCDNHILPKKDCIYAQIKKCTAPCINKISKEKYSENIQEAISFLNGNYKKIKNSLKKDMEDASVKMNFEKAATIRDKIKSIDKLFEKQIITRGEKDKDIISIRKNEENTIAIIFFVRDGKVIGKNEVLFQRTDTDNESVIMQQFIEQYYSNNVIPHEIFVNIDPENKDVLENWLTSLTSHKIILKKPQKGDNLKLIELATQNADLILSEKVRKKQNKTAMEQNAIKEILEITKLEKINRIESYDISHISGVFTVGSMIVFENNRFNKKAYRKFRLEDKNDDFNSLKDMLYRRFTDDKLKETAPDVLFVDGGKEQVKKIEELLNKLIINIPVIGMVKNDKHQTDHLYYNNKNISIKNFLNAFKLIALIQDETHNFAINYNRTLREKSLTKSILDEIPGVGNVKKKLLLLEFGDIQTIKSKTAEELTIVPGISLKLAEIILEKLKEGR